MSEIVPTLQKQWQSGEKVETKLSTMASEAVRNIRTVKSFANEDFETQKYHEKLIELYNLGQKDRLVDPILSNIEKVGHIHVSKGPRYLRKCKYGML